ncbi:unnamed protein product [Mycena citricolor]|uniref:Secreted protein n=1 Tax=Mycena citricolor TaxID=2018698 RepID=A0AAD2HTJ8_9AGAR|nr:unnamed protein product [Mycena citricolor]
MVSAQLLLVLWITSQPSWSRPSITSALASSAHPTIRGPKRIYCATSRNSFQQPCSCRTRPPSNAPDHCLERRLGPQQHPNRPSCSTARCCPRPEPLAAAHCAKKPRSPEYATGTGRAWKRQCADGAASAHFESDGANSCLGCAVDFGERGYRSIGTGTRAGATATTRPVSYAPAGSACPHPSRSFLWEWKCHFGAAGLQYCAPVSSTSSRPAPPQLVCTRW